MKKTWKGTKRLLVLLLTVVMILPVMSITVHAASVGMQASLRNLKDHNGNNINGVTAYVYRSGDLTGKAVGNATVSSSKGIDVSLSGNYSSKTLYNFYIVYTDSSGCKFQSETIGVSTNSGIGTISFNGNTLSGDWYCPLKSATNVSGGGVTFDKTSPTLVGTTVKATAKTVAGYNVSLSSSDVTFTSNSNGVATFAMPKKPVTVTATYTAPVTGVELKTTTELFVGNSETLTPTISPSFASNKNVTWESDNDEVATVDQDGLVTALAAGTANITVTTVDGSKTATCAVTVYPAEVANATYAAALTLSKNIDVNFKIKNLSNEFDIAKFAVEVDGAEIESTKLAQSSTTVGCVVKSVCPDTMSNDIHIVLSYDGLVFKEFDYNVRDYCEAVFAHDDYGVDSELGALCKALLNYGAATENYAYENDDSTLNEGYAYNYDEIVLPDATSNGAVFQGGEKVSKGSADITLGSTTSITFYIYTSEQMTIGRMYIRDYDNMDYKIPMKYLSMYRDTAKGCYVVTIDGIEASKLFKTYSCTFGDIDPEDFSITYSVKDYCCRMAANSADARLVKLCKALYSYGYAANDYAN